MQVIKEVEGALDGWKSGGRYKDMGILDQVRLCYLLCAAPPVKKLGAVFTAVPVIVRPRPGPGVRLLSLALSVNGFFTTVLVVSFAQVANKDYQWAY